VAAVKARPRDFDLATTDFNMPQMTGLQLARARREIDLALPMVTSSGFVFEKLRTDAAAAGVVTLVRKEHTVEDQAAVARKSGGEATQAARLKDALIGVCRDRQHA